MTNKIFKWFKHFFEKFWICLAIIGTIIQIIAIAFPEFLNGWIIIIISLGASIIFAFVWVLPKREFSKIFNFPDVKITIKKGNILKEKGHLIIGFSDTFDTEIGDIISKNSLQGQFLESIYGNNRDRLDKDIEVALSDIDSKEDQTKEKGKNKRYEIGTVAVLSGENKKYFCCAYSYMNSNLKVSSSINDLWLALDNLWSEVRERGEQKSVFIPVIGVNLARANGLSYKNSIILILVSFIINSRIEPITKELTIVLREEDIEKVNLLEIKDFLNSLNS